METTAQNNWIDAFLQEAEDLLAEIDEAALELSEGEMSETIHRIFRAFHTIKGSSGMCGLTAVADFTHHIETLLDKVRSGVITATPDLADLVLAGRDQVRVIIAAELGGEPVPTGSSEKLVGMLKAFAGEQECGHKQCGSGGANPNEVQPWRKGVGYSISSLLRAIQQWRKSCFADARAVRIGLLRGDSAHRCCATVGGYKSD